MSEYYCSHKPPCCTQLAAKDAEIERLKVEMEDRGWVEKLEADRDRWRKMAERLAEALKRTAGVHQYHKMAQECVSSCPHAIGREAISAFRQAQGKT